MPDQLSHRPAHQEGGQLGHRPSHAGANLDHRPAYTCHPLEEAGETSGEPGSEELLLLLLDQVTALWFMIQSVVRLLEVPGIMTPIF